MAPRLSLYIATTLDGFIARTDGAIDWLTSADENNTDYGYDSFYSSIDGVIMGSTSYELIRSFGDWPYADKTSFVFTRRLFEPAGDNIHFVSGDPAAFLQSPDIAAFKNLWLVGGSVLISAFHKKNLIDEYILTVLPVVLGHGLRLFTPPIPEHWLTMVSCQQYEGGVLQLHYQKRA